MGCSHSNVLGDLGAVKAAEWGPVQSGLANAVRRLQSKLMKAAAKGNTSTIASICAAVLAGHCDSSAAGRRGGCLQYDARRQLLSQLLNSRVRGQTALAVACKKGQSEVVALLVQQGANPWLSDKMGDRVALHYACLHGHAACVRALLDNLPEHYAVSPVDGITRYQDVRSISGFSPLHFAATGYTEAHVETVEALLEYEPHLHVSNMWDSWEYALDCPAGSTPLHVAAAHSNTRVALAILRHHAERAASVRGLLDPRLARNREGMQPWRVAREKYAERLATLLHPRTPMSQVFAGTVLNPRGALPLANIAAAALKKHLALQIENGQCGTLSCSSFGRYSGTTTGSNSTRSSAAQTEDCATLMEAAAAAPCNVNAMLQQQQLQLQQQYYQQKAAVTQQASAVVSDKCADMDEGMCSICYDNSEDLQMAGCPHRMCRQCALQLVQRMNNTPAPCPFCRTAIGGFKRSMTVASE